MKDKGITLIALVVTIIVLLILAGVSIATLTGDNGILNQAQRAKEETEIATDEEQRKLAMGEAAMNFEETEYIDKNGTKITMPAGMAPTRIEGESTVKEGLVAIDKNGNEWVWIEVPKPEIEGKPEGLTFSNETGYSEADEGACTELSKVLKEYAVPYSKDGDAVENYWKDVWYAVDVGVDDTHTIVTESTQGLEPEKKELKNGCGLTLKEYKENYQKMLKSIYKNEGFWIGRYEAGIEGSTGIDEASLNKARSSHADITSASPKAISQKDAIPYNYVTCSEAQELASQMSPDETRTSSLMFGIQWDLVCKYLEKNSDLKEADINNNSGSWGNYKDQAVTIDSKSAKGMEMLRENSVISYGNWKPITGEKPSEHSILLSTGASNKTKKLNIYDLAGNAYTWTLEFTGYSPNACSSKSHSFDDSGTKPASCLNGGAYCTANSCDSFIPTLF